MLATSRLPILSPSSVIVFQVHINRMNPVKLKRASPIPGDGDGPGSSAIAFQLVRTETWNHQVVRRSGSIDGIEHTADSSGQLTRNPSGAAFREKLFQPFMLETLNHE
jgi:hypothetical protein